MALDTSKTNFYRIDWTPTYEVGETPPTHPKTSNAFYRGLYGLHSIHVVNPGGQTVVVQVSNVMSPAEGTDADWVTLETVNTNTMLTPQSPIFRWIRFKLSGGSGAAATIAMLSANRLNS